jgi:hypothetical protein
MKSVVSQFWKPEVQNLGVSSLPPLPGALGHNPLLASSSSHSYLGTSGLVATWFQICLHMAFFVYLVRTHAVACRVHLDGADSVG